MKYKKSRYNVVVQELDDGRKLIYNTFTGIFGVMDKKTESLYDRIEALDIYTLSDDEDKKNIDIMEKYGYIIDADCDELARIGLERAMVRNSCTHLSLTVAPTIDCNMRCPYCYEDKSPIYMSREIQDGLIAFIEAQLNAYPQIKRIAVTWYGGEPLLQKDTVYNLSERIIRICNERNLEYTASIITNGSLLDAETASRLANDCKVRMAQITVDGLRDYHNKRRILINGDDSYGIIMKNIEACKDFLKISVRVNVDKQNADQVEQLASSFLNENGWRDNPRFYFAPVESYTDNCMTEKSCCFKSDEFAELDAKMLRMNYSVNSEAVRNDFFARRKALHCGGENLCNFVIDPEGYFYNCWLDIGNKKIASGHISKPFLVTSEYAEWVLSELPVKCKECNYLPMCQGGCGHFRIGNGGEPHCSHTLYSYKEKLKLAYEDYMLEKSKTTLVNSVQDDK